jgi:hypothetical protein
MLDLSNVTLVAVSSIKIGETLSALYNSMSGIKFAECKLITHHENLTVQPGVKVEKCYHLNGINLYNRFVMYDLGRHVETDYCLLVQHDGFVLRPEKWSQEFLEYDYIGAPWPVSQDAYITFDGERVRVGNGGFSLRSKSLLDAPNKHNIPFLNDRGFYNEDGNICVYNRKKFLELGMKFAPIDIAARFSQETQMIETEGILPFGFHRTPK